MLLRCRAIRRGHFRRDVRPENQRRAEVATLEPARFGQPSAGGRFGFATASGAISRGLKAAFCANAGAAS